MTKGLASQTFRLVKCEIGRIKRIDNSKLKNIVRNNIACYFFISESSGIGEHALELAVRSYRWVTAVLSAWTVKRHPHLKQATLKGKFQKGHEVRVNYTRRLIPSDQQGNEMYTHQRFKRAF